MVLKRPFLSMETGLSKLYSKKLATPLLGSQFLILRQNKFFKYFFSFF